jgi:hypothetical protein
MRFCVRGSVEGGSDLFGAAYQALTAQPYAHG